VFGLKGIGPFLQVIAFTTPKIDAKSTEIFCAMIFFMVKLYRFSLGGRVMCRDLGMAFIMRLIHPNMCFCVFSGAE
jgi:hypothetical protein